MKRTKKNGLYTLHALIANNMEFWDFEPPEIYSSEAVLILQPVKNINKGKNSILHELYSEIKLTLTV